MAGDSHLGASAMTGTTLNVVSFLFLGFFLGMRHATDADHVVAIATIVSRERVVAGLALTCAALLASPTPTTIAVRAWLHPVMLRMPPPSRLSLRLRPGPSPVAPLL